MKKITLIEHVVGDEGKRKLFSFMDIRTFLIGKEVVCNEKISLGDNFSHLINKYIYLFLGKQKPKKMLDWVNALSG